MAKRRYTPNQQEYNRIVDDLIELGLDFEDIPIRPKRVTQEVLQRMRDLRERVRLMAREIDRLREHMQDIVDNNPDYFLYGRECLASFDYLVNTLGGFIVMERITNDELSEDLKTYIDRASKDSNQEQCQKGKVAFMSLIHIIEGRIHSEKRRLIIEDDTIESSYEDEVDSWDRFTDDNGVTWYEIPDDDSFD